MSRAKRRRRQSIRGSQAAAKKKRRTASRSSGPTLPSGAGPDFDADMELGFLASGAGDALRRVARALDSVPTADDEDDGIAELEIEFAGVVDYLAQLDDLLDSPIELHLATGDGDRLWRAWDAERQRLGGRKFSAGEVGVDPFDALDRIGRIALLSTDLDRAIDVIGLMLARGTDWDPFEVNAPRSLN